MFGVLCFKISDSRFQIEDSRFQIEDSRFQIEDSRLRISLEMITNLKSRYNVWNADEANLADDRGFFYSYLLNHLIT